MNILTQIPQKIEQRKSPLQEVGRQLAKIGSSGSFATRLTVAAGDLHLEVQGVGRIRFPITPSTARRLCAAARPARHGFKDETRLDQRVRDTWEIAKSRISIDQFRWMNTLAPQLDRICRGLGLPQGCRLKAQLYNMLVYAPGQFFAPHQDSEKTDDMIDALVVSVPSRFTGGAMSIEHHGAKMRVGGSDKSLTLCVKNSPMGRELAGWILTEQWAWLLERSRQIRQHVSAKDVTREMVSLCKPILRVIESSRATQQPDLSGRLIAFLTADATELPVQVPIGLLRNAKEHHAPTTLRNWGLRHSNANVIQ